ncbi:hypothetical protein [Polaromonas hydrogenivorans]|uniref:Secreted protein n=1 Tax=Polaromonas hydrogenivorans TaxID=335476 RepID=A0AAU7LXP7_9BURK
MANTVGLFFMGCSVLLRFLMAQQYTSAPPSFAQSLQAYTVLRFDAHAGIYREAAVLVRAATTQTQPQRQSISRETAHSEKKTGFRSGLMHKIRLQRTPHLRIKLLI